MSKVKKHKHGMAMNKKVVLRFLREVVGDSTVILNVTFFTDKSEWAFGAHAIHSDDNKSLLVRINRCLTNGRDLRDLLLHEVGHLKGEDNHNSSLVEKELSAQLWAIKRAKELKWTKRAAYLEWELRERWAVPTFKWNSGYRKYILASKLAKKRKLV